MNPAVKLLNIRGKAIKLIVNNYASSSKNVSPGKYCFDSVRQFDKENFLCTILLKNNARTCALAVRAFNVEVARIQDQISQSSIGEMRFQFWDDALEAICNKDPQIKVPNHPVVVELRKVMFRHKLTKRYLQRILTSRRDQIHRNSFRTIDDLETYAEQSVSSVLYLLLEGCSILNVNADHAASHVGKAQGITNLLRSLPYAASKEHMLLPQELLIKYNISDEQVLRMRTSKELKDAVFDLASKANQHLEKARSMKETVPEKAFVVLLPAISVDLFLKRLRKHDFDIFSSNLQSSSPILPFMLWWNNTRAKY